MVKMAGNKWNLEKWLKIDKKLILLCWRIKYDGFTKVLTVSIFIQKYIFFGGVRR